MIKSTQEAVETTHTQKNTDKEKDLLKDLFSPKKPISQRITFQAKVGIQLLLLFEHNLSQKLTAPFKGHSSPP